MSDFEETWNADMRAALSGLLVEESLFSALDNSVLDTNAKHGYLNDDEKMRRVRKAFAYADLCAKERYRNWRLERRLDLIGLPVDRYIMQKFKTWFVDFADNAMTAPLSHSLIPLGVQHNCGSFILRKAQRKLGSLGSIRGELAEQLRV